MQPPVDPGLYQGVGGWLLVLCIVLTITNPVVNLIGAFNAANALVGARGVGQALSPLALLLYLGIAGSSLYAGIRLWSRRPGAVRTAKRVLVAALIASLVYTIARFVIVSAGEQLPFLGVSPRGDAVATFVTGIAQALIFFTMWFSYLVKSQRVKDVYATAEAAPRVRKRMSPVVIGVLLATVVALGLGVGVLPTLVAEGMWAVASDQPSVTIYLKDDAAPADVEALRTYLLRDRARVKSVAHISKEEALSRLKEAMGSDSQALDELEGNPLPASLEITLVDPRSGQAVVSNVGVSLLLCKVIQNPDSPEEFVKYGNAVMAQLLAAARTGQILLGVPLAVAALVLTIMLVIALARARRETPLAADDDAVWRSQEVEGQESLPTAYDPAAAQTAEEPVAQSEEPPVEQPPVEEPAAEAPRRNRWIPIAASVVGLVVAVLAASLLWPRVFPKSDNGPALAEPQDPLASTQEEPAAIPDLTPEDTQLAAEELSAQGPVVPDSSPLSPAVRAQADKEFAKGAAVYLWDAQPGSISGADLYSTTFAVRYVLPRGSGPTDCVLYSTALGSDGTESTFGVPLAVTLSGESGVISFQGVQDVLSGPLSDVYAQALAAQGIQVEAPPPPVRVGVAIGTEDQQQPVSNLVTIDVH